MNSPDTLPPAEDLQIRVPATPEHTNAGGDIFGGWVMSQVDIAGSIPCVRRSRGRVVTVAVNRFVFEQPVHVGDMVSVYARITRVGRTSMTTEVTVYVERHPRAPQIIRVARAEVVYVAVDEHGRPRPVEEAAS